MLSDFQVILHFSSCSNDDEKDADDGDDDDYKDDRGDDDDVDDDL